MKGRGSGKTKGWCAGMTGGVETREEEEDNVTGRGWKEEAEGTMGLCDVS